VYGTDAGEPERMKHNAVGVNFTKFKHGRRSNQISSESHGEGVKNALNTDPSVESCFVAARPAYVKKIVPTYLHRESLKGRKSDAIDAINFR
jgi:hypothetical protein